MRVNKNKIWILSILLVGLISTVFLNKLNFEKNDFNDISNEDFFSKIRLSSPSDKNWWDSSYKYRTVIHIINIHTGVLPKGYSVNISVNTSNLVSNGKLRSDGKDLRVVWYNSSSTTWLELDRVNDTNFNTENTQIWFKTQASISPSVDDTNYYLYYGYEDANDPPTNKNKIYDFFDDFTQTDGDADGWTVTLGTGWSVINNEYRQNELSLDRRTILDTYTVENATIEVRIKHSGVGTMFGGGVMFRYSNGSNFYTSGPGFWGDEVGTGRWTSDAPLQLDGTGTELDLIKDNWYDLRIEMLGNHYDIYLNDTLKNSVTNNDHLNPGQIGFMTYTDQLDVYFDDLKIALLVETQPTLTTGTEEIYSSWFNKNWNYHKTITVTSSSATVPSDYAVSLNFDHESLVSAGRSNVNGDDVRVVYWNGSDWQELDRMIDPGSSWNSSSTKIWFKTQAAIAVSSFDNNYYLYYGNTLAGSPPTNSDNIFLFYDDFESGNFNLWDGNNTDSGDSITVSSDMVHTGNYSAKAQVDDVENAQAMIWKDINGSTSLFTEIYIYLDPSFYTSDHVTIMQIVDMSAGWQNLLSATIYQDMSLYMWNDYVDEAYGFQATNNISTGTWHLLEMQATFSETNGEARLWMDGNLEVEQTSINLSDSNSIRFCEGYYWGSPKNETNTFYIDNTYLRSYVYPEPVLALGTEEMLRPSLNDFDYYKEITIDHTKVSGSSDLIDFPVLISIFDSDLHNHVQPDGDDIAFYNGSEWLDHEIELFDQDFNLTHAQLDAWVRVPSLSPSTDTVIKMYYGNATMGSQENPSGVWDSNFAGVWHLSEDPAGTVYDSTYRNNHGTSYGSMDSGDQILGKIDGSIDFDGNDDNIGTEENNLLAGCSSLTMSAWIKPTSTQLDYCGIIEYDNTTDVSSFDAGMELRSTMVPRVNIWTTSGFEYVDSSVPLPTTEFTYFVFVYDGDLNIYLDGSFDSSTPHSGNVRNNRRYINIGRNTHDGRSFNGTIDEVRISNINRSVDWIATEYNNQYDPNSFYSVEKEYSIFEHPPNANHFKYYKEIIINHTKVDGMVNLPNFSVLINILDSDLHDQNKVQAGGEDLAFAFNNLWLDHEIEYFNQTYSGIQAKLVAWVKIPSLSPSTNTIIKMYYGNSTMSSRENPTGTWDDNYVGVWHLSEDPSGAIYDSTSNNNDGTPSGSMSNGDQIPGKIDGSLEFDGIDDYVDCGNDASLDLTGNLTLQYWVMAYNVSNDPDTVTKGVYTDAYSSFIYRDRTIYFRLNGVGSTSLQSQTQISLDEWVSVTCTRSGSTMRIYINGTQDPATSTFSEMIEIITDALTIARSPDNLEGMLDEVRVSNIARSADWITTEYNNQYAPDSFYTIGPENQLEGDTSPPNITINSPNPNELFGLSAPDYDLTVVDANLDSIWYSVDGGTNSTPVSASGTIDQTMWSGRPNGTVILRFYANDTLGNLNYTERTVRKDILSPTITVNLPSSYDLFGSSAPDYDLTVVDANLDSIWYSVDGGTNSTPVSASGTIDQTMWGGRPNGTVILRFYANDTLGNLNYTEITVRKDILAPNISILEPNEFDLFGVVRPNVSLSINDGNLEEIWYQLENASITTSNYTWMGFIAQSVWDQIGNGTVTLRFFANDTIGNLGNAEIIVYKDIYVPIINIVSPNLNDVYNGTAPSFTVSISGSNLNTTWYTLNNGITNYTFIGVSGTLNQSGWNAQGDGTVTIKFYINNSIGISSFDEVNVIKDTIAPQISLNLPLNNSYWRTAPIIKVLVTDANLDTIWYEVNASIRLLSNDINQQLDALIWTSLLEGEFYIYIYANDSANTLSVPIVLHLYKDTNAPSAPLLTSFPQGEVSGNINFIWEEGSDPSGILKYRLIIDDEADPFATPGFVFDVNITGTSYEFTGTLPAGTYHFFLYQIDGAGNPSPAATGSFSITSGGSPSQPPEFPLWIIFVIIGAAVGGGVVGIVVLKKSKNKKQTIAQIPEKKPISKPVPEISEKLTLLDYDTIKVMSTDEINAREETLLEYIKQLEENKKYTEATEFIGEMILIENFLGNIQEVDLYRQKQIDTAVKGLEYLQSQYEIESKKAAVSGDYSKALEFYNESKTISENLKGYMENQESSKTQQDTMVEEVEPQALKEDIESVYSCINDLLTKYFDEIGIKYYSTPQLYDNIEEQIHGLILTDNKLQIAEIDPLIRGKIRSIQIIYTDDLSNENLTKLCQTFQNPFVMLIIVCIKWPVNIEGQTIEIPPTIGVEYHKNIRIINYQLFATEIGLQGVYETAFKEIIEVYKRSEFEVLRETHESSEIIIHSTEELIYDLREKDLITSRLDEYFLR